MGALLARGFALFAVGFLLAFGIALLLFHVGRRDASASEGPVAEDWALVGYMLLVTGAPSAAGFAIVTSPWPAWRRIRSGHRTWMSLTAGFAAYAAYMTGLASVRISPFSGFVPFAAALRVILPGIATGLIALAIVRLFRRERSGDPERS